MSSATCWNLLLVYSPMGCIRLPVNGMMGVIVHSVLWITIIPYNYGKGSTLPCRFVVRKRFSMLVSCLECDLIQAPTFSFRVDILLADSAGVRYRYVYF